MKKLSLRLCTYFFNGLEKVYLVISLYLTTGALLPLILFGGEENQAVAEQGSPVMQGLWLFIYSILFVLILRRRKQFIKNICSAKLLLLLIAFSIVSSLWSIAPDITVRRSLALLCTTSLGGYIATRYTFEEWLELITWTFITVIVTSVIFALVLPRYGIDHSYHAGAWQGVFVQKNILGRYMVLACSLFLILSVKANLIGKYYYLFAFLLALLLMAFSTSMTALVSLLLIIFVFIVAYLYRKRSSWLKIISIVIVLMTCALIAYIYLNVEIVLDILDRDMMLTGRIPLWIVTLQLTAGKYLYGYGYSAFWIGKGPSADIWQLLHWEPQHGHNGFLDLILHLGIIGFGIFVLGYIKVLLRSIKYVVSSKRIIAIWPLIYLIYLFMINLTESNILNPNNFFWVIYVAVYTSMSKVNYTDGKYDI